MEHHHQQQQQQFINCGVEDITSRLGQMNVDMLDPEAISQRQQQAQSCNDINNAFNNCSQDFTSNQQAGDGHMMSSMDTDYHEYSSLRMQETGMPDHTNSTLLVSQQQHYQPSIEPFHAQQQQQRQSSNMSNILLVTNVDSAIFADKLMQAEFESLFRPFDMFVTFRYLKSFRRVRLDFTSVQSAEMARTNLSQYKLGNTEFKCYSAQMIKPNSGGGGSTGDNNEDNSENMGNNNNNSATFLNIPKLTKQFLISPPASPPVDWEPVTEQSPCIDVQLISAIANLVPGKVHEIHAGNESQPGIFVEVCEDVQFHHLNNNHNQEQPAATVLRTACSPRIIPRTMGPAGFSQQQRQ